MRRFGIPPEPRRRYTRRAGVYAILLLDDRVLLTHQDRPTPEFQLPGGGIDSGEHPLAALHREVMEETGWRIAPGRRLSVHCRFTFMPDYDLWARKICTIYLARPVRRHAPPTEASHRAVWAPLSRAADMVANVGDADALARIRRAR